MKTKLTLGIDTGISSVGSALLDIPNNTIVEMGSRTFPPAHFPKTKTLTNAKRRECRLQRRQVERSKRRNAKLKNYLCKRGMYGSNKNPYMLRAKALDEILSLSEIGTAIYHLSQRRGYASNRVHGDDKDGVVKKSINAIEKEMEEKGYRTYGELCSKLVQSKKMNITGRKSKTIKDLEKKKDKKGKEKITKEETTLLNALLSERRSTYISRSMIEDEFYQILHKQQEYHPEITDEMISDLYNIIFYQRPLRSQKHLKGNCIFEPKKKVAPIKSWEHQESSILQFVNNVRISNLHGSIRELENDERSDLIKLLTEKEKPTEKQLRKVLKTKVLKTDENYNFKFDAFKGSPVSSKIISAIGKDKWYDMTFEDRVLLVNDLTGISEESGIKKRLSEFWGFDDTANKKLLKIKFPKGYGRLSKYALMNIRSHLLQGLCFYDAYTSCGYKREDSFNLDNVKDPIVKRAVIQTIKVIDAHMKSYPEMIGTITIEIGKDIKYRGEKLIEYNKRQKENEKRNDEAKKYLEENGIDINGRNITKYNLWKECDRTCVYTGKKPILHYDLFVNPIFDIEHILPYSRTSDNTFGNKTLCYKSENIGKSNRTPYEMYANDENAYHNMMIRVRAYLPKFKQKRFLKLSEEEMQKYSVSPRSEDNSYIAKLVRTYCEINYPGIKVTVTNGRYTGTLRRMWDLNKLLGTDEKNRDDHRHHAIDAIVIALTDSKLIQQVSELFYKRSVGMPTQKIRCPIGDVKRLIGERLDNMVVSHASKHRVRGQLHEETFYPHEQKGLIFEIGKDKRHVKLGNNHHVEVILSKEKSGKDKWKFKIVSMLEAYRRKANSEDVVRQEHEDGKFLFPVYIKDTIMLDDKLFVVTGFNLNGTSGEIHISELNGNKVPKISPSKALLRKMKLMKVDVLGNYEVCPPVE